MTDFVLSSDAIELLASVEHTRWSDWQDYMFSKGRFNDDGTWTMPVEFVKRWRRQSETPYERLSEPEKESDRTEVRKWLICLQKLDAIIWLNHAATSPLPRGAA